MSTARNDPRILRGLENQFKLREGRIAKGEKPIGWKVGFGASAAQSALGIDAPLLGFLTEGTLIAPDSTVSIANWVKTAVEPEVALHIGTDVAGDADHETARKAIAALGPAIELVDINFPPTDVEAILAVNIYHNGVILGRSDTTRARCVLDGLSGRVYRKGVETIATTELQSLPGKFVDTVQHVAGLLSVFGLTLRAGEIIIAGSIVPPLAIKTSETVCFLLDPIDAITVNIEA